MFWNFGYLHPRKITVHQSTETKKKENKTDPVETRTSRVSKLEAFTRWAIERNRGFKTMLFSRLFKFHALHIGPTMVVHGSTMCGMHPQMNVWPTTRMHEEYSRDRARESRMVRYQRFSWWKSMPNGRVLYDSFIVRLERNVSMEEELHSSVEILNFCILISADPCVSRNSEDRSYNGTRLSSGRDTIERNQRSYIQENPRPDAWSRSDTGPLIAFNSIVKFLKWSNCKRWVRRKNLAYITAWCIYIVPSLVTYSDVVWNESRGLKVFI